MSDDVLLFGLLLAGLGAGLFYAFKVSNGRRELASRLEQMVRTGVTPAAQRDVAASIRLRQQGSARYGTLVRFFQVPQDLPLAHVMAEPVVFIIGFVVSIVAYWFGQVVLNQLQSVFLAILVGVFFTRSLFAWEMERYQQLLMRQLPDTIQLVVSSTRAGLPISESFRAVAQEMPSPTKDEFVRVGNEISLGSTPDEALLSVHQRTGLTEYAIFAVTIGVQTRSGGRLAETIQNLADTIRERMALIARAKALSSEARLSAVIMGFLPILAGGYMMVIQPAQTALLFTDPRGNRLLVIAIVSLLLGAATMRQLIKGVSKE
jgi:tight adherence protein B